MPVTPRLISYSCVAPVMGLLLAGCGGGSGGATRTVSVQFKAQVNGQPFACGGVYDAVGTGLPGKYRIDDLRFYVHDVELVKADGGRQPLDLDQDGVWQYEQLALVDLENGCANGTTQINDLVVGKAAAGDYTGVCFKLGIPAELNHINDATAPSPLNSSGMLWSWRAGRKFLRVDGVGDPGNINQAFHIHLGSTECPGTEGGAPPTGACGYPNIPAICLDGLDLEQGSVVVDVGQVLEASNVVANTPDTAPGCMSGNADPECIPIFPRLGLDYVYASGAGASPEVYGKLEPQRLFGVDQP